MNILLVIRELELGSCKGIHYMFLSLQVDAGGNGEVANRNMATGAPQLLKGSHGDCLEPIIPNTKQHFTDTDDVEKVEMNWNMEANSVIMFTMCLAQIQRDSWA